MLRRQKPVARIRNIGASRAELLAWALERAETENLRAQLRALPDADLRQVVAEMQADEAAIERTGRLAWLWAGEDEAMREA